MAIQKPLKYNKHTATITMDPAEGRTEQSHKDLTDVNNIMSKYQRTGVVEHRNDYRGQYGFVEATTFQECQEVVAKAKTMFEELPSNIRKKFNANPQAFLEFVQDEKNIPEMIELGLANSPTDVSTQTPQVDPTPLDGGVDQTPQTP